MAAIEIIKRNGKDLAAYTEQEREIVKAYGWAEYGFGFADTVRAETETFDHEAYLDATFC